MWLKAGFDALSAEGVYISMCCAISRCVAAVVCSLSYGVIRDLVNTEWLPIGIGRAECNRSIAENIRLKYQ
jgi:hypothetical protein